MNLFPRIGIRHWIKEDIHDEAMAKAEAAKTVNSKEPTHPIFDKLMQYLDDQSTEHERTEANNTNK